MLKFWVLHQSFFSLLITITTSVPKSIFNALNVAYAWYYSVVVRLHFWRILTRQPLQLCCLSLSYTISSVVPFYLKIFQIIYNSLRFWWYSSSPAGSGSTVIWKHCRSDYTVSHGIIFSNSHLLFITPAKSVGETTLLMSKKMTDWGVPESVLVVGNGKSFQCYILVWRGIINQSASRQ